MIVAIGRFSWSGSLWKGAFLLLSFYHDIRPQQDGVFVSEVREQNVVVALMAFHEPGRYFVVERPFTTKLRQPPRNWRLHDFLQLPIPFRLSTRTSHFFFVLWKLPCTTISLLLHL
jgi:hypothetical protein